jgi:hypothetical protein
MNKELIEMLNNMIVEESWEKCDNIFKSLYTTLYFNNIRYGEDMTENQLIELLEELYDKGCLIDIDVTLKEFKEFVTKDIDNYFSS